MTASIETLRSRPALPASRALILLVVLGAVLQASAPGQVLFSPYKDITVHANYNTGEQRSAVTGSTVAVTSAMPINNSTLTWAFATGTCGSETWAGITPAMEATNAQDFVNAGKYYIVSTGGEGGSFNCSSNSGMLKFIETYYTPNMLGVDYDIENGQSKAVIDDLINSTIYAEQKYPNMRFSFTLATVGAASTGSDLDSLGNRVMSEISSLGLGGNYYIDLMAFDYGSVDSGSCVVSNGVCDMAQSAIAAAESLHSHFGTPYSHIELCLMIGEDDSGAKETLSLANVDTIAAWAKSVGLGGIHYWSFDRDKDGSAMSSTGDGTSNSPLSYNNEFTTALGSCTGPGGLCSAPSEPSFTLSASPTSASVVQGASATSTITVASANGFDSPVTLSVSGLPSGVTASLSPDSVTPSANASASAVLTLTAGSAAAEGTATVTINGTGGGLTAATSLPLTVTSSGGSEPPSDPDYNVYGIYTDGTSFTTGGLDNEGYAYSANLLGSSLTWNGTVLPFGPANAPDAYTSETITLPAGQFSTLNMLATGLNGNRTTQTFTVNYTDGTTDTFTQSLSDWHTPQRYSGETTVLSMAYRDTSSGGQSAATFNLYGYSFAVNSAKTLASLTLPNNRNVVVLAVVPNLSGSHTLTPQSSTGLRLDDLNSGTAAGNSIDVGTANQTGAQTWAIKNAGVLPAGYYNLAVSLGSYCLTASAPSSGSPVQLNPCDGDPAQAWEAVPVGTGFVFHPATNSGLCLDADGDSSGALVQAVTCTYKTSEQWTLN